MSERSPLTRGQRVRYAMYAVGVTVFFLLVLDGVLSWAEHRGWIDTTSEADQVSVLAGDPWVLKGDQYVTSTLAREGMAMSRFAAHKGDRWRGFMVGGSFLRGVPYPGAGSIHFWLSRELRGRFPQASIELINGGATSQNSHRVLALAQHAAELEPDVLIIASCNNEGSLPPKEIGKRLHKSATYRVFKTLLRASPNDSERPVHTPQDADIDAVRAAYESNLREMIAEAREAGAEVLLCTLPVNLRYDGNSPGRPIGDDQHADNPAETDWPACARAGEAAYRDGRFHDAIRDLSQCEHPEALRWSGLSMFALGRYEHARAVLSQYVEVMPRNRCRPSFQRVIRRVAEAEKVTLVDLEALAIQHAPHGIPGPELFESYCHMNWRAQGLVADAMLDALLSSGRVPPGPPAAATGEDRARVFARERTQPID